MRCGPHLGAPAVQVSGAPGNDHVQQRVRHVHGVDELQVRVQQHVELGSRSHVLHSTPALTRAAPLPLSPSGRP